MTEAATFGATLRLVQANRFGVVVTADRFPEGRGRAVLRAARLHQPEARRVLVAPRIGFEEAVDAINEGKPHAIVRDVADREAVLEAATGNGPAAWSALPAVAVPAAG